VGISLFMRLSNLLYEFPKMCSRARFSIRALFAAYVVNSSSIEKCLLKETSGGVRDRTR
jgi:hypothetical protein